MKSVNYVVSYKVINNIVKNAGNTRSAGQGKRVHFHTGLLLLDFSKDGI